MEQNKLFIGEMIGKKIIVKTHWGIGTKEDMLSGDYKGMLVGFDGRFIKLEYELKKFTEGSSKSFKKMILINMDYVITAEEYESTNEL